MEDKFHLTQEQNLFMAKKTMPANIYYRVSSVQVRIANGFQDSLKMSAELIP